VIIFGLMLAGVLATAELFFHIPVMVVARHIQRLIKHASATLCSARISEAHKEHALLLYARRLLWLSVKISALLLVTTIPMALASLIAEALNEDLLAQLFTPVGMTIATIATFAYAGLRKHFSRKCRP
jgi:hypothetical protein